MKLTWYGHSCFLITSNNGKRILIDPFDDSIGYSNNFLHSDIITISHNHFDHSFLKNNDNNIKIINTPGRFDFDFASIEGFSSFHDKLNGLKRGTNIIYTFTLDKLKICHLGDLGEIPSELISKRLEDIDILLVPIGGHFTLNGEEGAKISKLISPKYIIPIHYKTFKSLLYLDDPKNFLINMNNVEKINSNILTSDDLKLYKENSVLLLSPP
ncbi:MBL fold metallo-hydrolase [Clostridium taeniosporum]|uniref:Zn-dependent hydrolase n=1 Tax=Clostridium taeniosporum TaxID=394958 RepID=A0A1D7XG83_9CLOT|nr:MBL fold metallo-hydrolase [Clostridium taeniosporum]AOR22368.1 Zn-dependent hydrolase [Clostridium taeniosporum]